MRDNIYKEDDIISLNPREHVRLRPGVYAGDTSTPNQLLMEIFANALDEHNIGHGNIIQVDISEDGSVEVQDNGQGFPINVIRPEDNKTILEASFSVMNTSGKFSDDGIYEGTSLGLNGMGGKLSNFLSSHFEVTSYNNKNEYETVIFKDGLFEKRKVGKSNHISGTIIKYKPDKQFFDTIKTDIKFFENFFHDICCLCPSLKIVFNNKEIYHPGGIKEILPRKIGNNVEAIENPLSFEEKRDKDALDFVLTFTTASSSVIIPYVNYGYTDSGPHITAIKSVLTRSFNNWAKENGFLKEKDKNLDGSTIQEGMILVCNIITPNVAYNAQVKTTVTKMDTLYLSNILKEKLEVWLDSNPEDAKIIIEKALLARKAAEAAKKAREAVKNQEAKKSKIKLAALPSKLADCHGKNRLDCELYVTEGDSASGGAKIIRDASFQAIMGLKGKILNTLVADYDKIHKNAEVMDIVKALGLDWSSDGKRVIYDKKKLRYGKFVIAADRDPDGSHIQSLVLTMLWTLIPDLILDGYVYIALPPLYKAEWGTQYKYLADKKELEEFSKTHKKFTLSYYKGLGEASPEELGTMIMNPETRNIQQVTVEDIGKADIIINNLMGSDSQPKKDFVFGTEIKEIM